jgi:(E)-4-hydroxy-3-methylbut-2-enyl-diphosphate synthase
VVKAARERKVPIRIGVNFGSLPQDLNPQLSIPQKMVEAALRHIRILENLDFDLIKVSLKAFDVPTTIAAYKELPNGFLILYTSELLKPALLGRA